MSKHSSDELYRQHGFSYRIAREEHGEAIARLLGASFADEPMSKALGLTAQDLSDFASRFIPECTTNGLSVIAVSEEAPGHIAGVLINRDFKAPLPAGVPEDFPRNMPAVHALVGVAEQYEAQVPGLRQGQAMDLWMAGIGPGDRCSHRGIPQNLLQASIGLARDHGFERCIAECTSYFSQRRVIAAGFQERSSVIYKDIIFEGKRVFTSIPEPHVKIALYELILKAAPGR